MSASVLEQLKNMTTVVADTGDIEAIKTHQPTDATTNPSLILAASKMEAYQPWVKETIAAENTQDIDALNDALVVRFGQEILKVIPGRVSTEIDATLSFDTQASIRRAQGLIERFAKAGINKQRVLIKIAATWEGIQAARALEKDGIHCNLTLIFSQAQAKACADAGVQLISPFVGRIMDWYAKRDGVSQYEPAQDPGVQSVTNIYNHYKSHGYETEVMAASFRNSGQILALSGCDLLTIAPKLLTELNDMQGDLARQLTSVAATEQRAELNEANFRFELNEDAMATEKLSEGIRAFAADQRTLHTLIQTL